MQSQQYYDDNRNIASAKKPFSLDRLSALPKGTDRFRNLYQVLYFFNIISQKQLFVNCLFDFYRPNYWFLLFIFIKSGVESVEIL